MDTNPPLTEQLLTLSREMLKCAEAADWEQLVKLEQSRLPLFHEVFSQGISDNVELAREVLLIDEKTKGLAKAGMPVLQDEILSMRNSDKVKMAYQAVHDFTSAED